MEPFDVTYFETADSFRAWLAENHESAEALWVGYWKKATGRPSVTWEETVDEALCFGWIDGLRKTVDEQAYTIRFTPRRATSVWSRRNLGRIEALSSQGRLAPSGAAAFAGRRIDKSDLYSFEQERTPELSSEFVAILRANAAAWEHWQSRPPGYRWRVSHWVMSAKRADTRERRLSALISDSAAGLKVKPFR